MQPGPDLHSFVGSAAILQSPQFEGLEVLHNREPVNRSNVRPGADK